MNLTDFRTDFYPVAVIFSWLVPPTPDRLPALILLDCLDSYGAPEEYVGPIQVDGIEAARLFREALAACGSGPVGRWLGWAAASISNSATREHGAWRAIIWLATVGLLDLLVWLPALGLVSIEPPWHTGGAAALELLVAAVVACGLALPLSLLMGRRWRAAALIGGLLGVAFLPLLAATCAAIVGSVARRFAHSAVETSGR